MAPLLRPAVFAALALALVPAVASADTSNIVFPVAGPVLGWHDDYGTLRGSLRQRGNSIAVAPGTPVVAAVPGRVRMLWRGSGGWSVVLTTADGNQFVYLHLGRDGNRKSAYLPSIRDGQRVKQGQPIGKSGFSGSATRQAAATRLRLPPARRPAGRSLRTARERAPAARLRASRRQPCPASCA